MASEQLATRAYGVGFSGSSEASGSQTWVTGGDLVGGEYRVDACRPAVERFGVSPALDRTLPALTSFLSDRTPECAVGLDFPFGLPAAVVAEETWEQFLFHFPDWFNSPADLSRRCRARGRLSATGESTPRRATERAVSAIPAYSARLASQTFYGIRDVLRPLVLTDRVRVPPMTEASPEHPLLLEVYPAATLENLDAAIEAPVHWNGYEVSSETGRQRRGENVDALRERGVIVPDAVRERVVADTTGRGLKSLVAGFATARNVATEDNLQTSDDRRLLEGYIHV